MYFQMMYRLTPDPICDLEVGFRPTEGMQVTGVEKDLWLMVI